jgi:hypothetical protein
MRLLPEKGQYGTDAAHGAASLWPACKNGSAGRKGEPTASAMMFRNTTFGMG